ncbi:hypothetical protein [Paludisphaera rhizosphaerae]|uniref:hypothetical protein n=1 Tax=Paludisphaera rhizosphaerae TaxID=2711216 RepID=UPI0013EAF558|nr:hypothetical protein [Paludisphaera rhizosphaerae]
MEPPRRFHYRPICSAVGCTETAVYKVGAPWSDGTRRELKNYGLACPAHCDPQLERARINRNGLKLEPGETMGDVRLFLLDPDRRDTDLQSVGEDAATA